VTCVSNGCSSLLLTCFVQEVRISGASAMRVNRLINVLSEITLIEMMVTIGLGVTFSDVLRVSRNYARVARAVLASAIVLRQHSA
jgi:hypothetical protein